MNFTGEHFAVDHILSYTQTKEHQQWWWVVPELAARSHAEKILVILEELAVDRASIDTISVTVHPGLPGALVVWITSAYTLWKMYDKPVVEVNHIMGHVFSILVERTLADIQFPYICLTISGWHNDLYLVESSSESETKKVVLTEQRGVVKHNHLAVEQSLPVWPYRVTKLWQTIDDASGECFDKVARMLWWPYPGWRWIGEMALNALHSERSEPITLHAARLPDQPYNFSFSGIKGQLHQQIERWLIDVSSEESKSSVAYFFQEEVTDVLTEKLLKATQTYGAKTVGVVWWVSANLRLREKIAEHNAFRSVTVLFPTKFVYCTDNAAMIGVVWLLTKLA